MRSFLPIVVVLVLAGSWPAGPACAETTPRRPPEAGAPPPAPKPEPSRPVTLDDLFGRLASAASEDEAKGVAGLIERRLERSGSDTADLLMSRAGEALTGGDAALAVELLDRVTQLRPGWAEAWNRRAMAFHRLEDPARAVMDLEEALAREPRHFAAWLALGHVETANGDKRRALAAYRRALAVYPLLEEARKMVDRLAPDVDGRDL